MVLVLWDLRVPSKLVQISNWTFILLLLNVPPDDLAIFSKMAMKECLENKLYTCFGYAVFRGRLEIDLMQGITKRTRRGGNAQDVW